MELEAKLSESKVSTTIDEKEYLPLQLCNEEIKECENLLMNLYRAKKQLESFNIVFPKYLDMVALASIYEYLIAGRCSKLEGPDGAYNLFENELRQNIIISKLDVVIDKLEEIKQNQFMIYQALSEINSNLEMLNSKMDDAIDSLENIEKVAKNISKTTEDIKEISEVTAYNTAKTAYYSKVNAELTNALGFMVALK